MGIFHFKQFSIDDTGSAMKTGTDGVLLGAWASMAAGCTHVIDAGAGSGLITLIMAQRYPGAHVTGVEIDPGAAACAKANAAHSPWPGRIDIVGGNLLELGLSELLGTPNPGAGGVCIVSNPPFFTEQLRSPSATRALARHGQGLNVASLIAWSAGILAEHGGSLNFIAPAASWPDIEYQLALHRLAPVRTLQVSAKPGAPPLRCLCEAVPEAAATGPCKCSSITIRNQGGDYTDNYRQLTASLYLNM